MMSAHESNTNLVIHRTHDPMSQRTVKHMTCNQKCKQKNQQKNKHAIVTQLVEYSVHTGAVVGSNPTSGTIAGSEYKALS